MKFSNTFTLATLALLSIGSEARIGRSLETANPVLPASESSPNAFPVYIAIGGYLACPNCEVGILDQNEMPISKTELGDAGCVQVGVISDDGLITNPDSVSYFVKTPYSGGFSPGNANCTDIGNKNNLKCGLQNMPENACVILG